MAWLTLPRLGVRRYRDIIELNGHRISPYYGEGGPMMWPTYGMCIRCGHSILGGADAVFGAERCGRMD